MEIKRQQRLQSLSNLLRRYKNLPLDRRIAGNVNLRHAIKQQEATTKRIVSEPADLDTEGGIVGQPATLWSAGDSSESEDSPVSIEDFAPDPYPSPNDADQVQWAGESLIRNEDFACPEERPAPSFKYDLSEQLIALYESHRSFKRTIQAIADPSNSPSDSPEEASESKNQLVLTNDEDNLWSDVQLLVTEHGGIGAPMLLEQIMRRSTALSDNYERRCKPPTEETYTECKLILQALGVPCIEARSPFEAEGLASSLVRRGLADFVASEDTVSDSVIAWLR